MVDQVLRSTSHDQRLNCVTPGDPPTTRSPGVRWSTG